MSSVVQFSPRASARNCREQLKRRRRISFEGEISILYLHLKHRDRIIQHLYTNCQHLPGFSRCRGRCPTTSVHTSWRRMTVRHFRAGALHTKTVYIIHHHTVICSALRSNRLMRIFLRGTINMFILCHHLQREKL